jgi:hypothetical protein
MKFKATPAQNIALHTLQSVGLSALVTLIVSLGQFVSLHGLDWQQLATFAAGGFLTSMTMMWKTLSTNPNTMQAILDTVGELKNLQTSPVTIHNNLPAPAVATPAPPAAAPQPTPQIQFVQPAPFPYQPSSTFPQMPVVQP